MHLRQLRSDSSLGIRSAYDTLYIAFFAHGAIYALYLLNSSRTTDRKRPISCFDQKFQFLALPFIYEPIELVGMKSLLNSQQSISSSNLIVI